MLTVNVEKSLGKEKWIAKKYKNKIGFINMKQIIIAIYFLLLIIDKLNISNVI